MNTWQAEWIHALPDGARGAALEKLIGGGAEGWPYLKAINAAPLEGVIQRYLGITDTTGPIAWAPAFLTDYTWMGFVRRRPGAPNWLKRAGTVKLLSLGAVFSSELGIHFAGGANDDERVQLFAALVDELEALARVEKARLLMIKDINARDAVLADPVLRARGYARMVAPPLSYLQIPPGGSEALLAGLKRRKRRNIVKSLRPSASVEIDPDPDVAAMADEFWQLAETTRTRAGTQFGGVESIPKAFYTALREHAPKNSRIAAFRLDGKLIAFSLSLLGNDLMFGKSLGIGFPEGRDAQVYFRIVMDAVDAAAEAGLEWLCLGQLGYATKLQFGVKFEQRYYYIKSPGAGEAPFQLFRGFVEGQRFEQESADFSDPEYYFASDPNGPQPPAHLMFGTRQKQRGSNG